MSIQKHPTELQLIEWIRGRLPDGDADELAQHLRECPTCGQLRDELQTIHGAMESWRELPKPVDIEERVRRAINVSESQREPAWPWWVRSASVAASVVLSVVTGHLLARAATAAETDSAQSSVSIQTIEQDLQLEALASADRDGLVDLLDFEFEEDNLNLDEVIP